MDESGIVKIPLDHCKVPLKNYFCWRVPVNSRFGFLGKRSIIARLRVASAGEIFDSSRCFTKRTDILEQLDCLAFGQRSGFFLPKAEVLKLLRAHSYPLIGVAALDHETNQIFISEAVKVRF